VEFFRKATNFPFMSTRKVWYGLSLLLMVISIGSFFVRGLNLAVDFTGGVQVQAGFTNAVNVDALRTGLEGAGFQEPQVQILGSSRGGDPPAAAERADGRCDPGTSRERIARYRREGGGDQP
jgi:preprotein translocase subunit SecF